MRVRLLPRSPANNGGMTSQKVASLTKVKLLHTVIPPCNIAGGTGDCVAKKKTHAEYVTEIARINQDLEVVGMYDGAHTKIEHRCKKCGNIILKEPISALKGSGCPVCKGRMAGQAPEYKNSIWSSEYREYFSDYMTDERMKTTLPFSNIGIDIPCPSCGRIKHISPSQLLSYGYGCICGDGKSYPNKFMYQLLEQLDIDYIPEYSPDWAANKLYDIYVPYLNLIIENHGRQHYKENCFKCELEEVEQNDLYKERLAITNGIQHYCIIDCKLSKIEWLKESVMNSVLPLLLNFEERDIDWLLCDKFASSNLINDAAKLFNNGFNVTQVANKLNIHRKTARMYIKKAASFGLCHYDPKEERNKATRNRKAGRIPIYCLEKNAVCYTLGQMSELCMGLDKRNIHACLTQKHKTCGGMHFYYLYDHTIKNKETIKGAITLGFISKKDAIIQLEALDNVVPEGSDPIVSTNK